MANDDEISALLREIRDIQQQHLEAYRSQSQRSISMSAVAVKRQRISLAIIIALACGAAWYSVWSTKDMQDRAQQQLDQWQRQMDEWRREVQIDNVK